MIAASVDRLVRGALRSLLIPFATVQTMRYSDFEIKLTRDGESYKAQLLTGPMGEASHRFSLPFSRDRLELLVLKIGRRQQQGTRGGQSAELTAARELGAALFESVFAGDIRACFRSSVARTTSNTGLRLKLRLQDVPELAHLPWELLFDRSLNRFLAQSIRTPIVRYIELPVRVRPLTLELPLRVLVMVSNPSDRSSVAAVRERTILEQAFEPLIRRNRVEVTYLDRATLRSLHKQLRRTRYHVFHFIGHGRFNNSTQEGQLILENHRGRSQPTSATRMGTILHDHRSLRLATLNACEGGRGSMSDSFSSVATTLIRQGIPAVIAMQFEITDRVAVVFAEEFYTMVAERTPVDCAITEARKAIYALPNEIEWVTPVLYTRASDGVLFTGHERSGAPEHQPANAPERRARRRERHTPRMMAATAPMSDVNSGRARTATRPRSSAITATPQVARSGPVVQAASPASTEPEQSRYKRFSTIIWLIAEGIVAALLIIKYTLCD